MIPKCVAAGILCSLIPLTGCGSAASSSTLTPTTAAPKQQVKNIIVVTMQNASFDHLFGTFPGANGPMPGDPGYVEVDSTGAQVSPFLLTDLAPPALPEGPAAFQATMDGGQMDKYAFYNGAISMGYYNNTTPGIATLWSYAQQYALADNFFSSVIGEAPSNQLYMVAANDNGSPYSVQPSFGPCQQPDPAAAPLGFPNVADQLTSKNIQWGVYQQDLGNCAAYLPLHDPFQFFTSTHASPNIRDYSQFQNDLAGNTLPAVSFIYPNNASDMHPGYGSMEVGAAFLDSLIQAVQSSAYWNNTAILVTWDTGGGWYDHVAPPAVDSQGLGSRVPLLAISPLAKKGYISHTQLEHVSILKFIQSTFGLASLNPRNDVASDLTDLFQ